MTAGDAIGLIFLTPVGWVGMVVFALAISIIRGD